MKHFICQNHVFTSPYTKTEYMFSSLETCASAFIEEATKFFVESWLNDDLQETWLHWNDASEEEKAFYYAHWEHLRSTGILIDDPGRKTSDIGSHHTAPIGAFAETMLRWLQKSFGTTQLLIEPPKSKETQDGKVDFIEVTGTQGDYTSFKVTLWEVKSSDGQIAAHNTNVYRQIEDYRLRFLNIATCLSESYEGNDIALKKFLRDMGKMAWKKQPSVHYGVFVTYDANVEQKINMVPKLHKYPKGHPDGSEAICHHLALLLIPDFKDIRLGIWKGLHLLEE